MPRPSIAATRDAPSPPQGRWQRDAGDWTLTLSGDWRGQATQYLTLPAFDAGRVPGDSTTRVVFDTRQLQGWDAALAAQLFQSITVLRQRGAQVQDDGLPEGLRALLELAAPQGAALHRGGVNAQRDDNPHRGHWQAAITVAFFGEVLLAMARWLRGRSAVRAADVLQQLDHAGPRSLPIVMLTCGLLGLMLAYMGGAQLGRIGAQGYLADVVTVGMVRELAGLMTGIILAGRLGSAFAAQLATMQAGEEIDALRVLGVDPISHLVLPRLLALLLMAPALIAFGAVAGIAAGWPAAVLVYGVTSPEYLQQCLRAVTVTHVWIGLFKGMVYVALVALAGCREGLNAGRSAQAVGAATTSAVVKGLVWIVAAACLSTVVFTNLGF